MRGNASPCNSSHGNMHSVQLCVFAHRAMTMPHSHLSGNIAKSKDERHASRMHSFSETVSLFVATGRLDLRKRPNYLCYLNPACRQHFYCRSTCIECLCMNTPSNQQSSQITPGDAAPAGTPGSGVVFCLVCFGCGFFLCGGVCSFCG